MKVTIVVANDSAIGGIAGFLGGLFGLGLLAFPAFTSTALSVGKDGDVLVVGLDRTTGLVDGLDLTSGCVRLTCTTRFALLGNFSGLEARLGRGRCNLGGYFTHPTALGSRLPNGVGLRVPDGGYPHRP